MSLNTKFWITSDSHFSHNAILDFERGKKFKTIQEHDEFILSCWDSWMTKADKANGIFVFLGDFGKPSPEFFEKIKEVFSKHPCGKFAVLGNHDKDYEYALMSRLFDVVSDYPHYIDKRVVISHMPQPVFDNVTLNIHGHTHASQLQGNSYLCASIHVAGYQPITTERITSVLGKMNKYDTRFLYEPWAEKYLFTKDKRDVIKDKDGRIDLSASRLLHYLNAKERRECGKEYSADDFLANEVHFYD